MIIIEGYSKLKLYKKIMDCGTIGELAMLGCQKCGKQLYAEGSAGFGSLWCSEHGCNWHFWPSHKEKAGYASKSWKNHITGESSAEYKKRIKHS